MKRTKTLSVLMAMTTLLGLATSLNAQTNTPPDTTNSVPPMRRNGMSVDGQLHRLSEQLQLTDAQKPQVKAALEEQNKQMKELRDLAPTDRRAKMQSLRADLDNKMKAILTADQYQQFEKMRNHVRPPSAARTDASSQ
jgi:Spy/CpxP family protein refolding chaperone